MSLIAYRSFFQHLLETVFLFYQQKVKDTLPPMPKKQNLAMLEAPPEPKSIAYVGPPYKTLPPIGSAPPTGRQRQSTTPRKLSSAPGATEKTPRDENPPFDRSNSMPPEFPKSVQYQSGRTTRQTVKTDGEATVGESVGTADGRRQPHAHERLNTDDRFFMTQVRHLFFFLLFLFFIFEENAFACVMHLALREVLMCSTYNGCKRALSFLVHGFAIFRKTTT